MIQVNRENCNEPLQEFVLEDIQLAVVPKLIERNQDLIERYEKEKKQAKSTITLSYGNTHKVDRVWNGKKKDFYPKHLKDAQWVSGLGDRSKWLPYRNEHLISAEGKFILWHEGEKATDFALNQGFISTCIVGSGFKDESIISNAINLMSGIGIKGAIYIVDHDDQGVKKAKYIQQIAKKLNFPVLALPITTIHPEAEKGGDFVEYLKANSDHTTTDIKNDIEIAIEDYLDSLIKDYENCDKEPSKLSETTEELPWLEQARNDLFEGDWICVNGVLYKYNGQFYKEQETGLIKRNINQWCCNYIDNKAKKSKATPESVDKVFKWVCQQLWVSPTQVNTEGLPLANGILKVSIDQNDQVQINLDDYSPDKYFTYQSEIAYNPDADQSHALDLLLCLDEPYKSLFIQSLATILNPKAIKRKWDRIKALMLIGEGSNGKDTLREVISLILGKKGITGCSLNDFRQADTGRGFNLIRLASNPRINWSSENKKINIDGIQALKQAITGDPIYLEAKGKDGFEVELNTLFIFNGNDDPSLKGNQKAIQSRLAVIPFEKVYSTNPIRGELKANPRYKHDKQFLINYVCPAMLNLLLDSFSYIYQNGIDYETSNDYFEQLALENNHLKQFSRDMGLEFTGSKDDTLFVGDIYESLLEWYQNNGFLEFETKGTKVKNIWLDNGDKVDPPVKRSRDLKKRLKDTFPKAKELKIGNKIAISGVRLTKIPETHTQQEELDSHQASVSLTPDSHKTNVSLTTGSSKHSQNNGSKVGKSKNLDSHQNNSRLTDNSDNDQANVSLKLGYCESNVSLDVSLNNNQKTSNNNSFENLCESKQKNNTLDLKVSEVNIQNGDLWYSESAKKELPFEFLYLDPKSDNYPSYLEKIAASNELVIDTETFSPVKGKKSALDYALANIRLIQIYFEKQVFLIDLGGINVEDRKLITKHYSAALDLLNKKFLDPETKIIGHNLTFDLGILAYNFPEYDWCKTTNIWDTLIGLYVYYGFYGGDPNNCPLKRGFSLKNAVEHLVGVPVDKEEQLSDWGSEILNSSQIEYACFDCHHTYALYQSVLGKYKSEDIDLWEFENAQIALATQLTLNGFPFDIDYGKQCVAQIDQKIVDLEKQWLSLAGDRMWEGKGSAQTDEWLKEKAGIENLQKVNLSETNCDALIVNKQLKALRTHQTKIKALIEGAINSGDSRVHSIYKSLSGLGRYKSSGSPATTKQAKAETPFRANIQSVSNRVDFLLSPFNLTPLRKAFNAPEGKKLIIIDLPAAHARIAADVAGDQTAIEAFNNPIIDNHSKVAVYVAKADGYEWSWEKIAQAKEDKSDPDHKKCKLYRGIAKNVFYAFLNGAGAKRIAETIAKDTGLNVEISLVEAALNGCRELYPQIRNLQQTYTKSLNIISEGGVQFSENKTLDGFRLLMGLKKSNYSELDEPQYCNNLAAIWTRVEATAMKKGLLLCQQKIWENPRWNTEVVGYIHDEIDFMCDEEYALECAEVFNNIIGDCFAEYLSEVSDGRETDLNKLICDSWADKV